MSLRITVTIPRNYLLDQLNVGSPHDVELYERLSHRGELMKWRSAGAVVCVLGCAMLPEAAPGGTSAVTVPAGGPVIQIDDVSRFYQVYDAAAGHPTADQLQRDYLDPGSDGLHQFAKVRKISGTAIAAALTKNPATYADAKRCMLALPQVRELERGNIRVGHRLDLRQFARRGAAESNRQQAHAIAVADERDQHRGRRVEACRQVGCQAVCLGDEKRAARVEGAVDQGRLGLVGRPRFRPQRVEPVTRRRMQHSVPRIVLEEDRARAARDLERMLMQSREQVV